MFLTVCPEPRIQTLDCKRQKADTQLITDGRLFVREDVWTADDFPGEIDTEFAITHEQYQSLKQNWIGTAVKPRDPRVTDLVLTSWGMRSWKQYVLDRYLTNY